MPDNPWIVDLSPERMPEGWRLLEMSINPMAGDVAVRLWKPLRSGVSGYGPTPTAALADAIRKAREASDDNR